MLKIERFVGNNHPQTSKAMEEKILSKDTWVSKTLTYIIACGNDGATDYEIQQALCRGPQTIGPSRGALVKRRLVVDSGKRRLTGSGNEAIVWVHV